MVRLEAVDEVTEAVVTVSPVWDKESGVPTLSFWHIEVTVPATRLESG